MVKDCKVFINNEYMTAFYFDKIYVQLPPINKETDTVRVLYENGRYTIVDDDYIEPTAETKSANKAKKKTNKKTILNENAEKTEGAEEECPDENE